MRWFLALRTTFLRTCSNVFMTFAWYSYLRNWGNKKWYIAAVETSSFSFSFSFANALTAAPTPYAA
jgi:uncharacterized protein (DUF486 family)